MNHNPPVTGRFSERDRAADGSYAGRRPPSLPAAIHALFHGRVLIQYRPDLPRACGPPPAAAGFLGLRSGAAVREPDRNASSGRSDVVPERHDMPPGRRRATSAAGVPGRQARLRPGVLVDHRREPGALRLLVRAARHHVHRLDRPQALLEAPAEEARTQRHEQRERLVRPPPPRRAAAPSCRPRSRRRRAPSART